MASGRPFIRPLPAWTRKARLDRLYQRAAFPVKQESGFVFAYISVQRQGYADALREYLLNELYLDRVEVDELYSSRLVPMLS